MARIDPNLMDRADDKRVKYVRRAARSRPHLETAKDSESSVPFCFHGVLGPSNPAALADLIRRRIQARNTAESHAEDGLVVHVRDGKPLTAHGAKLLGVPWKGLQDGNPG